MIAPLMTIDCSIQVLTREALQSMQVLTTTPHSTSPQVLTREALQSMQSQASGLAAALEHALLKYLSFQVNAKLGLSDGVKDVRM